MSKKGIISLVLSLVMVFTFTTPALAANLSDVEGTDYAKSVERLVALGIMTGYDDGSFKPDNQITRAEFSAMAIRALGLEDAAKGSNVSSKFSDVASNQWFTGYINTAAAKGIVKGHGDGTFKPNSNVTYGEAITMLVRALGYEPAIEGTDWPSNYVVKASEIGILGNVKFDANKPATRGDVAKLLNNSLDVDIMKQVTYTNNDIEWKEQPGVTLLTEYLNVHELEEAIVIQTAGFSNGTLDPDEVEIQDEEGDRFTFELKEGIEVDHLLGHEVTVFVKDEDNDGKVEDDEELIFVTSTTSEKDVIAWDYIVDMTTTGDWDLKDENNKFEIELDALEERFDLAEDVVVYYNYERITNLEDLASDKIGVGYAGLYEVAGYYLLNDDDDVAFMKLFNYDDPVVITEIDLDDEEVKYFKDSDSESTLDLDGETYTVYKNGKLATLDDLEEEDVLYYWEQTDGAYALDAYSGQVTGTLDAIYADSNMYWDYILEIDGTMVYVGPNFTMSLDENEEIELLGTPADEVESDKLQDLEDMVGEEVTVYIGKYQEATDGWNYGRHIVSSVEGTAANYYMVTKSAYSTRGAGYEYYIELVNMYDQETVFEFTEDDTEFKGIDAVTNNEFEVDFDLEVATINESTGTIAYTADLDEDGTDETYTINLAPGTLVDVDFASDGYITGIEVVSGFTAGDVPVSNLQADYDRIKLSDGTWYYVTDETAIFSVVGENVDFKMNVYEAVSWDDLEDLTEEFDVLAASVDDKELEAIVVRTTDSIGALGTDDYGLVLNRQVKSDGLYVTLAVEDQMYVYYAGDLSKSNQGKLKEGALVKFELDGSSLDSIDVVPAYQVSYTADSTKSINLTKNEFKAASITVTSDTYGEVTFATDELSNATILYEDTNNTDAYEEGSDAKIGTFNSTTSKFTVEAGYTVDFKFSQYFEIASGGIDVKNGVVEAVVRGLDEDVDPIHYLDVDVKEGDSYFYNIKSSFVGTDNKIISLGDFKDGYTIYVYDVNDDGIFDYMVIKDY